MKPEFEREKFKIHCHPLYRDTENIHPIFLIREVLYDVVSFSLLAGAR